MIVRLSAPQTSIVACAFWDSCIYKRHFYTFLYSQFGYGLSFFILIFYLVHFNEYEYRLYSCFLLLSLSVLLFFFFMEARLLCSFFSRRMRTRACCHKFFGVMHCKHTHTHARMRYEERKKEEKNTKTSRIRTPTNVYFSFPSFSLWIAYHHPGTQKAIKVIRWILKTEQKKNTNPH